MRKILTIFIMLSLLSNSAYAMNLGSAQRDSYSYINSEDSAMFRLLFWNSEEGSYMISMTPTSFPDDWTVISDPSIFYLSRGDGDEYISLPYTNENVMAKSVNVYVKPDEKATGGVYEVDVMAQANAPEMETSGMSIASEKLFKFYVNVSGQPAASEHSDEPALEHQTQENEEDAVNEDSAGANFYIALVLVAAMSILIYKKYK